jgi:tetraacyldisaccharide 4'-kinase
MSVFRHLLWPIAWIYGAVIRLRHFLFDGGILASKSGAIKTIVLGNLALGGTGKTPHAVFMLKHFNASGQWAFLSRGYGRKTKGFKAIDATQTAETVGDEPLLVAGRLPGVACFVGEDRVAAIEQISRSNGVSAVLLDDALQHRKLKPDCAFLLTTWQRPFTDDHLLPVGKLRDIKSRAHAADAVIVTKCPDDLTLEDCQKMKKKLSFLHCPIFFTGLVYGEPIVLGKFPLLERGAEVLLVSAIADAQLFEEYSNEHYRVIDHVAYGDHYTFSSADISNWRAKKSGQYLYVLTTEKDAMRLKPMVLPSDLRVYYIPVEVQLLGEGEQDRMKALIDTKLA